MAFRNATRLAIVVPTMGAGGAERVAANLANAWAECGRTVNVLSLASRALDFYALDPRVQRTALDLAAGSSGVMGALRANARRFRALRRALSGLQLDAVLALTSTAAVLTILASRRLSCRVVVSERTYPPRLPVRREWDILRRFTYPLAHRVVMQTTEGLAWLNDHVPRARGIVIPNAACYPLPAGNPVLAAGSLVAQGSCLLLAVGRLNKAKQFDCVLASFADLALRHAAWQLVILGDGPERASLERQAELLGLRGRVSLPGRVGNMSDWYGRADLYVMSSRFEGFPNTLVEAMAHGCPAVSYDCDTGPRDIIRHEVDGLLVKPVGDVPALTAALGRLMSNGAERARMAARAAEVRSRYSTERILAMWDEALGIGGPAPAGASQRSAPDT